MRQELHTKHDIYTQTVLCMQWKMHFKQITNNIEDELNFQDDKENQSKDDPPPPLPALTL